LELFAGDAAGAQPASPAERSVGQGLAAWDEAPAMRKGLKAQKRSLRTCHHRRAKPPS
jgi:hypothetical protein